METDRHVVVDVGNGQVRWQVLVQVASKQVLLEAHRPGQATRIENAQLCAGDLCHHQVQF